MIRVLKREKLVVMFISESDLTYSNCDRSERLCEYDITLSIPNLCINVGL